MRFVACLVIPCVAFSCVRQPATPVCADVGVGDLVITEIHGDGGTPWVELYNASGAALELEGTRILFKAVDGSTEIDTLVRASLPAAAGAYTVFGVVNEGPRPSYVDYNFAGDWHDARWLTSAAVDVEVCGTRIDRVTFSSLPVAGSYSLRTMPPTAVANDLPASWCNDRTGDGTPQQPNRPCP